MTLILVTVVLAIGAVLRLYDLPFRGLIYWDEAKFCLEGVRLESALESLVGGHVDLAAGKGVGTAKPTHALLIAIAYLVLGVHDYAPLLINAACSVIGVGLTFLVGRRLFGDWVGIVAALFLATSEYDVIYSRSALSESDATMLFLAGTLLWLTAADGAPTGPRSTQWWRVAAAGFLLGLGFTTNYRLIVYVAILVLFDVVRVWRRFSLGRAVGALAIWTAGFLVAPVAWQLVDLAVHSRGLDLFKNELTGQWTSYFAEIRYQLHGGKQSDTHFDPTPYLQWFVLRQGVPVAILTAAGLGLASARRSFTWLIPATLLVGPFAVYTFAPFVVPRNLQAALPFASILAAAALREIGLAIARRLPGVTAVAAALVAVSGLLMCWRLSEERSGFAAAASYLAHHNGRAITSSEVMVFYLRGSGPTCDAPALPVHPGELALYREAGYRYAVLERHHLSPVVRYISAHWKQVAAYRTMGGLSLGEDLISSENSVPPGARSNDWRTEYVRVFRSEGHGATTSGIGPPIPCLRDKVT